MRIAGFALIFLFAVTAASAQDDDTMTQAQAKALSAAELFARGAAVISKSYSDRIPVDWQHPNNDDLLQDVWLTKPMRPVQPGLCVGEYLDLGFETVNDMDVFVHDPPVMPHKIEPGKRYALAGRLHHFADYDAREKATKATDCSGIPWPDAYKSFSIDGYNTAEFGVPLLAEALDEFPKPGSKLRVLCYHASCRNPRALFAALEESLTTSWVASMQGCIVGPFPRSPLDNDECLIVALTPPADDKRWEDCSTWLRLDRAGGRLEAIFGCPSEDMAYLEKPKRRASTAVPRHR